MMMPRVGFLPQTDPRIVGTVAAIQRDLMDEVLVRYPTNIAGVDGLPPCEGASLPCTFWLADNNLAMMGCYDEARAIFKRPVGGIRSARQTSWATSRKPSRHCRAQRRRFTVP